MLFSKHYYLFNLAQRELKYTYFLLLLTGIGYALQDTFGKVFLICILFNIWFYIYSIRTKEAEWNKEHQGETDV